MKTALALGTFDGVHLGHRAVLNLPSNFFKIAVVFVAPPKSELTGKKEMLMTFSDKCDSLKKIGMDAIFPLNFNSVKDMLPNEFLLFLKEKFNPDLISCGFNYRFGKDALGDIELLGKFCTENNIIFNCANPVLVDNKSVSSTTVRNMLKEGEINKANQLLLDDFSFTAKVIEGDKRGRQLGFPTINQKFPEELVTPKFGVYKSKVTINGITYNAVTDLGNRPTFGTDFVRAETFIKEFSGDLYGKEVTVSLTDFLREEVKFSSVQELISQIEEDLKK